MVDGSLAVNSTSFNVNTHHATVPNNWLHSCTSATWKRICNAQQLFTIDLEDIHGKLHAWKATTDDARNTDGVLFRIGILSTGNP